LNSWRLESGAWVDCEGIPLADRAFRYGMSLFETVAVREGQFLFFDEHRERLARAASELGWPDAVLARAASLPRPVTETFATGIVRIYLTAGPGAPGDIFCGSLYALYEDGEVGTDFFPVQIATSAAPYLPAPGGWKTGNYWQNIQAAESARRVGADEAVLFDPSGCLLCASMANVFLEVDGRWQTPALGTGARDGTVRAWVMKNFAVEEALLDASSLGLATAGFLTNSRVGVRGIAEIDGRRLQTDVSCLQRAYRESVLGISNAPVPLAPGRSTP
jgi:branched-chain amino acid aminotransferase